MGSHSFSYSSGSKGNSYSGYSDSTYLPSSLSGVTTSIASLEELKREVRAKEAELAAAKKRVAEAETAVKRSVSNIDPETKAMLLQMLGGSNQQDDNKDRGSHVM